MSSATVLSLVVAMISVSKRVICREVSILAFLFTYLGAAFFRTLKIAPLFTYIFMLCM